MNTRAERAGDRARCVDCGTDLAYETRCYVFDAGRLVKGQFRCLRCDRGKQSRPPRVPASQTPHSGTSERSTQGASDASTRRVLPRCRDEREPRK